MTYISSTWNGKQGWRCCLGWLVLVLLGCSGLAHAQDDWSVRNRGRRHRIVFQRFVKIVEARPERGFAFRRMVKLARQWPGLDRLLAQYRQKVKKKPKNLAYRLILAHLLYTVRQRQEALQAYQEVVKRAPNMLLGHFYLAALYRQLRKFPEALAAYQKAYKLAKRRSDKQRCLKAMGTLAMQLKQPQKALQYWKQFLKLRPGDLGAREEIARAMVREKLFGEALRQWNQILKRSGGSAKKSRVWRQIGLVHEQSNQWQKAVAAYRKSMSYTQQGHWLRRELNERVLQLHRENGKLGHLVTFLRKQRRKSKTELAMIARLLDELGRDAEAAAAYRVALRASPGDTKLRRKYITLLEVRSKMKEAIRQYRILIRREPREPRHRLAFSEMLSRMGKRRESLQEMRTIARIFSRNTEILSRLANLYRKRRMIKESLALYKRLIRLEPREPAHRRALGHYYYQAGEEKKARRIWQGILNSGMATHKAAIVLGQILRDHGLLREARKWYVKASRSRPKDLSYLSQLGELYQRILDEEGELPSRWLEDAIKIWKQIYKKARLRTRRKRAMHQLFAFYHAQGTLYRLPQLYRRRLTLRPNDTEALRWLGEHELWQAQRRGRRSFYQASYFFKRILQIKPDDLDAILTLEQLAARGRRWQQARSLLLKAVKVHPAGRRGYYRRICDYSLKMRANQDAIKYARKAIALNPEDASSHADLARIYRKAGKPNKAIAAYREAIRLRPNSHSYSLALADLMRTQGHLQEAGRLYRHVYKHAKDGRAIYESAIHAIDILLPLGESERLESELQSLADANPRELAYFRALAELYRRQGKMKAYRIAYLKAAATVDQKSQVYKQLAQVAQEQGDLRKAIIYFRKMLEESPNPAPREQIKLASFYLQTDDKVNARKILLGLLSEHPNSLRVLRQVAALLDRYNLHKEAIQAYEQFLDLDPQSPFTRLRLAHLYQKLQQYQAAIGLLSAVVWGYYDQPVQRKKKAKNKQTAQRKTARRRLPYYLRRYRYRSRYRRRYQLSVTRRRAMVQLMDLYKKLDMVDEWDRRLLFALKDPATRPFRFYMLSELLKYYQRNRWFERLQRILEEMRRQEPRNIRWTQYLAQLYRKQGRFHDALALYQEIEQIRPGTRNINFVAKLHIALEMKDKARVRYLVQEFLHRQVGSNSRTLQVLRLLKQHQQYDMMEKMLQWGLKYGSSYSYSYYIRELISVYLKMGKREQARRLLWREWFKPSLGQVRRSGSASMRRVMVQRRQLIARLWPLLSRQQKQKILKDKERELLELVMDPKRVKARLRRSLIDLYALMEVSQGITMAQRYLPPLWVLTQNSYDDRRLRQEIMSKLLQQGEFQVTTLLIRQSLKRRRSADNKIFYLLRMLDLLGRYQLFPPRSFSRFFERELRKLRTKVNRELWRHVAIQLADRYLAWGDYQRVVWWVALCQWTAPASQRNDHRLLLRLARAYRRKGNERLAKRNYAKVTRLLWKTFEKKPEDAFYRARVRQFLTHLSSRIRYRGYSSYFLRNYKRLLQLYNSPSRSRGMARRYRLGYRRYSRFGSVLRGRNQKPLLRAKQGIQELYRIHEEAGQKELLFRRLKKLWERTRDPKLRENRLFFVLASYQLDWHKQRNAKSLQALLQLLRRLLPRYPLPRRRTLHVLLASLEAEANQFSRALALYSKILQHTKKDGKKALLLQIAAIYGRAGKERKQWETRLKLATQYKDASSDKWLAQYYLERRQFSEAVRYYQRYLRRHRGRSRYSSYQQYHKVYNFISLAQFLMPTGRKQRILYFLLRATGTLRLAGDPKNYQYHSYMQRIMNLMLRIGQLRVLVQRWEKQRTKNTQDLHLLSMLRYAYRTLELPEKERKVMAQMVAVRPYDLSLLHSLLYLYQRESAFQEGLQLLQTLYQNRTPKPKDYHLWLGRFHHRLGKSKLAFAAWQKQASACERLPSSYQQFRCQMGVGMAFLQADGVKEALKIYQAALRQHSYRYSWMLTQATQLFLQKKAYKEAIAFVEAARGQTSDMSLSSTQVALMGVLLEAYKGLGDTKMYQDVVQQMERASYKSYSSVQRVGALLEKDGRLLSAERMLWRGVQKAQNKWSRRQAYSMLCAYWQRHALGRLCSDEDAEHIGKIEIKQSSLLAQRFAQAGFPYLALLQLRRLRLVTPNQPKLWQRLFQLSVEVGRLKEAQLWLKRLEQAGASTARLQQLQQVLQRAANNTRTIRLPSHHSWPPVSVPAYCESLRVVSGKLQGQNCQKPFAQMRCTRQLLHHKGMLITNDCMGRFIAIDAVKGRVQWMYALPRVTTKRKKKQLSFSRTKRRRTAVRQYYRVVDAQSTEQGDVLIATNHNWFAMGTGWSSGVHHQLHLIRLDMQTGKPVWHRVLPGGFARGTMTVSKHVVTLYGRSFQAFRIKDGKSLWHRSDGKAFSVWIFGNKDVFPHIKTANGWAVSGWDNFVYHYNTSGRLLWKKHFQWPVLGLAARGQTLVAIASSQIMALDLNQGKELWKVDAALTNSKRQMLVGQRSTHTYLKAVVPVIAGQRVLYVGNDGSLTARSLSDGSLLWKRKIGDHGPYPVAVDPQQQEVAFMGQEGTLSLFRLADGQPLWRYTFHHQILTSSSERYLRETHSPVILGQQQVWVGAYDRLNRFAVHAFWRKSESIQARMKRLRTLVQTLRRERRGQLALQALTHAIDRSDQTFRPQFLRLAQHSRLPLQQKFLWLYRYLATGHDIQQDLKRLAPFWKKLDLTVNVNKYRQPGSNSAQIALVKLMALLTHPNPAMREVGVKAWIRLCTDVKQARLRMMVDSVGRRFASAMLRHSDPKIQLLAAFTLNVWGDQEGRRPLLKLLTSKRKLREASMKRLLRMGVRQLLAWDERLEWDGSVALQDVPLVVSLLKHNNTEIRLRAALYLAHLGAENMALRKKLVTPTVRQVLSLGSHSLGKNLAILSALALARLGDYQGILRLRTLYNQNTGYTRNQIARLLYNDFEDFWGLSSLLATYRGRHRSNLQLPSFRIIYGHRLLALHRYNDALYQFQMVQKLAPQQLSSQHRAMALAGIGRCLYYLKRYKLAQTKFEQVMKLDNQSMGVYDWLGRIHFQRKQYQQARQLFEKAIKHLPYRGSLRRFLAVTYFHLDQASQAHNLFTESFKLRPDLYQLHAHYAKALYLAPRPMLSQALQEIDKALLFQPKFPRFLQLKAKILYKMGRRKEARQHLQEAVILDAPASPYRNQYIRLYKTWFKRLPRLQAVQSS